MISRPRPDGQSHPPRGHDGGNPAQRYRLLLALLVLIWAISWPAIKIGVTTVPPIWYGCWRYVVATFCLFIFVALRFEVVFPSRSDWRLVAVSGGLQMGAYSALTGLALTILPPGRASVLAFSTPLWVVPLAGWWLHEHLSWRALLGVGVGLLGALVIASPSFQRDGSSQILAYAMLLGAAAAWAISIVFVRAHRFDATPLVLAPWQMLVAAALLCPLAIAVEGRPPAIGAGGMASLAYVGPVATAFAYWAVVEVGRHFRASTVSMALLATPSVGLSISALTLGETVSVSLVIGVILVGAGIRLATMGSRTRKWRVSAGQDKTRPTWS
jgi:drug/metabolite transporter (DMT)-like permease